MIRLYSYVKYITFWDPKKGFADVEKGIRNCAYVESEAKKREHVDISPKGFASGLWEWLSCSGQQGESGVSFAIHFIGEIGEKFDREYDDVLTISHIYLLKTI